MADRLDPLFQEWHRLGGAVLLSAVDVASAGRSPEAVIADSTAHCRQSGRLTWVTLEWMIKHIEQIAEGELLRRTRQCGELSVLGVLCDAACTRKPHPKFERIMAGCLPHGTLEPFFHRVARSPLALRLTQENALDVFRRWNYLCNELRYL
ncbi:MAG: hypothetical protein ACE5H9_21250 [Anaerolineae bacterium]